MRDHHHFTPSINGFKHFFESNPLKLDSIRIRGVGVRENMAPCTIERPKGTMDYLMMLFHDPAFASDGGNIKVHRPETMYIWEPNHPQYYGNRFEKFSHTWIHCDGKVFTKILKNSFIPIGVPFQVDQPVVFSQCISNIHNELISQKNPDPIIIKNLLENALRQIARSLQTENQSSYVIPRRLLSVQRAISESPSSKEWTISELASIAKMSISHFCAKYKETFGISPLHYIIQQKMQHASHLLSDPNLSIKEISERNGYCDPFHFSKMFKKYFGKSPKNMRKHLFSNNPCR